MIGTIGCRERSTEASNSLPLGLAEGSKSLQEAEQVRDRKHSESRKLAGERSEDFAEKIVFLYCQILTRDLPEPLGFVRRAVRALRSGDNKIMFGELRIFPGALVLRPIFYGGKRYCGRTAPQRPACRAFF